MKVRNLIAGAAALMLVAVAMPAYAEAQVAGTWELSVEGPRGPQTMVLVLEMDGDEMTGTLTPQPPEGRGGRRGGGGDRPGGGGPPVMEFDDGTVDGDAFTFSVTMSMRGRSFTQDFAGTVDGDQMSGTMSTPRGELPFEGKRTG